MERKRPPISVELQREKLRGKRKNEHHGGERRRALFLVRISSHQKRKTNSAYIRHAGGESAQTSYDRRLWRTAEASNRVCHGVESGEQKLPAKFSACRSVPLVQRENPLIGCNNFVLYDNPHSIVVCNTKSLCKYRSEEWRAK